MSDSDHDDAGPNADANDEHLARALRDHGLFRWLNLDLDVAEPGRVAFTLPFDEKFTNRTSGVVHGGITATIIDTASAFALRSTFEEPDAVGLSTTDLNVRYVRPARDDLRVEAEVVRAGGTMGFTETEVTTVHEGETKLVATGGTSYRLLRE